MSHKLKTIVVIPMPSTDWCQRYHDGYIVASFDGRGKWKGMIPYKTKEHAMANARDMRRKYK